MYSVVLMIALTGSSDAVGFGRHSSGGCSGAVASCSGSSCHGGGLFSRHGGHGCHGATSGCAGSSCHGSSHGGLFSRHRSHGCHGSSHGTATCSGSSYSGDSVSVGCSGGVMVAPTAAPAPTPAPAPAKTLPKS